MSLNGARLRYVDDNGEEVLVPAKGRTFQIGSYISCDVILEPQAERLVCEITCDAFGRVTLINQSNKDIPIHLNDKIIHGQRSHPLLHGNRITILDRVYTWESHKMSGSEDVASTPERQQPVEQAPNSCPSLKVSSVKISASKYSFLRPIRRLSYLCLPLQSHRPQIDKRLTVHNFHYSINSDDEGNTSIESRGQNESQLDEQESLNFSTPPSTEETSSCETPKVDLVEATQNKENTATPPASHQKLLQLCARSDVVQTSFSPRETGVKVEKSFACVRSPTKSSKQTVAAFVTMSTPKSVYSTPKGGVLSELNDDSCSRDLMDFCTPSTSKKTKRQSSMYLIDLTTPSKLRPSLKPTPISVDSTDESSDGSPLVIDITKSATPPTPARSHLAKTPRRAANAVSATPTRTPQSLMKRALLTSTKKKQIAGNQRDKTPVATPNPPSIQRRLSHISPRMPFVSLPSPEHREARRSAVHSAPKNIQHRRQSFNLGTPRDNKLSEIRKSLAVAKRSLAVDMGLKLKAKARRTLNSPKSSSPKSSSSQPGSPAVRKTINMSHPKCSTPEKLDDSTKDELSRTFTIMNESGDPAEASSILGIISALVTGEMDDSAVSKILDSTPPPTEIRKDSFVGDELPSVEEVKSPKLGDNGTLPIGKSCQEPDDLVDKENTENCSMQANERVDIIEDSICEEVDANIPKQVDDDELKDQVYSSPPGENKEPTTRVETPMIRRSLRRLSVDQKAGHCSSTRRGSVGASSSQSETKTEGSKRSTRRASCSALVEDNQESGTPRRKRRFSEQMSTPTRQSKRLMMNTPKATLPVDDSMDDMGVIVEEDDDEKTSLVEDENYGKELPCDEPDNVDYHGLRDLLKTPKNCSTPRFKGLREMLRTPKVPASPIFGNIEELLDNSITGSTPQHSKTSRSITVASVAVENEKVLEGVLKTPSARNIMVPNEPASAVLKSRRDSLATTTEYDLDTTNTTLHLDQIFDDVPRTSVANMENTESEIDITSLSTASGLDPLKESVSSEAPMSVCKLEARKKDPLTSTTYKAAMQADLELSTFTEEGEASSRPSSLGSNEMSGIQLLDQTSDSMFSEHLIVSGVESCNVTVDETGAIGQSTYKPVEINDVDNDSNVGLTEPLVLSDDDDEAEVAEDSRVTPKKSIAAPAEVSVAYKLEESVATKDITLNQSQGKPSVNETSARGESISRESSLMDEVSLIEVNESVASDSISATKDEKSIVIELDSLSDTEAESTKKNDESAAVELTIVESETFPLDSTQEDEVEVSTRVDQNLAESGSEEAGTHPSDPLPSEELLERSKTSDVALTDEDKGNNVSETLPLPLDEKLETNGDLKPTDSEEDLTGKTAEEVLLPSEELAEEKKTRDDEKEVILFDSTADSSVVVEEEELLTNVDSELPISTEELEGGKLAEEDPSVPSEEQTENKITTEDAQETAQTKDSDTTSDSFATHINLQAELSTNDDLSSIDSEPPITKGDSTGKTVQEDPSVIDTLPSQEPATDKLPVDAQISNVTYDNMAVESLGQDAEMESISTVTDPEAGDVSVAEEPKSPTREASVVKADANDDTDEKPTAELEQNTSEVPFVNDVEIQKSAVEELPTDATATPETPREDIEVVPNEEESSLANPANIEFDSTSDGQHTDPINPAQEDVNETGAMEDMNPCDDEKTNGAEAKMFASEGSPKQIEADKTQVESVCEAKSDKEETTIAEFSINEAAPEKSPLPEVHPPQESHAADITAGDSPKRDASVIAELAITEINKDDQKEDDVTGNTTLLETPQNVPPTNVPSTDNIPDEESSLSTSSIIIESFTEQPKPASTEENKIYPSENAAIHGESVAEVNKLDTSSIAEEVEKDSVVEEQRKAKSLENHPEDVATSEEMSAQQDEFKPIEDKEFNEVEETSIDTSARKEQTSQLIPSAAAETSLTVKDDAVTEQPGEVATEQICLDQPITDILETSALLEPSSSPAVQDKSMAENPEINITEKPNSSIAVDGAHEASVTEKPFEDATVTSNNQAMAFGDHDSSRNSESSKDKLQIDESTSTDAESEGKSTDRTATEVQRSEEPQQDISLSATDIAVKSLAKTDHLSIEEEVKEAVINQSLTEDASMSEELTEGTSAHRSEGEQPQPDDRHINAESPNQKVMQTCAVKEVSDIIELSDDSSSESPPEASLSTEETVPTEDSNAKKVQLSDDSESPQEEHNQAPVSTTETPELPSEPIEETLPTADPKVEDVPEEGTPIAEDHNTVKEVSGIIELSDDSDSESSPVREDHKPAPADASLPIEETLPTEDSQKPKVEDVPEESSPIAEDCNTSNGPNTNSSVSIIETIANEDLNNGKVEDVSDELQNGTPAAPVTKEEKTEKPQASEKLEAVEITSTTESVANVKQDEKPQHNKSKVEGSADEESSKVKDESSEDVSSTVEAVSELVQDIEASNKEASNSENIQADELATPIISSSDPEKSEQIGEPNPEPSVSLNHSTIKVMHQEDEPSVKEKLKPVKRATRKGSASVETPAEGAMENPSRRTRKPSEEVEDLKSNDVHEKPKRRAVRKASAEVAEPMTHNQATKEEELQVIPEEAHSSRPNEDNEPQKEVVSDQMPKKDALEKPSRRARKPSEEVKSVDITEKPKRRARKPSAEVPEPMIKNIEDETKEEEQAQEADFPPNQEVEGEEEGVQNKKEICVEPNEENKQEEEELKSAEETKKAKPIKSSTGKPKRRGRKASAEETETTPDKKPKIDYIPEVFEDDTTSTSIQIEQKTETQMPEKPKRRGRKASAEEEANNVVKVSTSKEGLKSIVEEDNDSKIISTVDEKPEDVRTEVRSRRRGRKPSKEEDTAASNSKSAKGNVEKPLAPASEDKPSDLTEPIGSQEQTEFVPAEVPESAKETDHIERPKRRGRKPSVDIEHTVPNVPDKPRRRGRTPAEPEKQTSGEAKEEEPDKKSRRNARKPSAETVDAVSHNIEVEQLKDIEEVAEPQPEIEPLLKEEEPKTRRGGRKPKLETLEVPAKSTAARLRGRKATEDEGPKSEVPVEAETNPEDEEHNIVPADNNDEVQIQPADVVVAASAEKKTKRRVRKASANIDGTKKTTTRRGRQDSTKDEDNGQETKIDLHQVPTESVPAVVVMSGKIGDGAVGSEDDFTPRRREGRNMPRKNYDETTDEDKQRSARRPRKPAASKLLAFKGAEEESTPQPKRQPVEEVETPANVVPIAEPTSSQRREGRNVPRKNYTEAPDDDKPTTSRNRRVRHLTAKALELIVDSSPRPNTPKGRKVKAAGKEELPANRLSLEAAPPPAESVAEEDPAPVIAKGRAARRKATDTDSSQQVEAPSSKRAARGQHEESEEQPEAKPVSKSSRATGRKAKIETDLDEAVPTKKARGGSRAKTPDAATQPEDEPAKKPPARSRARGGAKAVAVPEPEQPVHDSDAEPSSSATTATRGGRAKKVHFEPTEAAAASAASVEGAPKRATRSRRV
ncbi:hypothetical protein KR059_003621 [Drosophila kikkawai]|nr:hypothetical protein KR059_003621 [Drosophila kikkawai]